MDRIKGVLNSELLIPCMSNFESCCWYLMVYKGSSPFCTMKFYYHAEKAVIGDPREPGSLLVHLDNAILNCLGDFNFDMQLPFVLLG